MAVKKETDRKRKFAREVLYPFIIRNSKSINDAQVMCEVMAHAIQTKFSKMVMEYQKTLSKDNLTKLELGKEIDQSAEYQRDRELLDLLKGESVASAVELIGGMNTAIAGFVKEETATRNLDTLKTNFL